MESINIAIGTLMRKQRKSQHLSMKEVGELIGVTGQMISLYELGGSSITISLLRKYCIVCKCNYWDLIKQASIMVSDYEE